MTTRERNLLILLLLALSSAVVVVGLSSYLQGLSRLDAEFIDLQKRALRVTQASLGSQGPGKTSSMGNLRERFFAAGTLPDPLSLAARVQTALSQSGLRVLESRVAENSRTAQWVQYHAEGHIESWFRFLLQLRRQDSQTLFRSISMVRKQGSEYTIAFEVGHVVFP